MGVPGQRRDCGQEEPAGEFSLLGLCLTPDLIPALPR